LNELSVLLSISIREMLTGAPETLIKDMKKEII